jgi:glycosyltransferase involved in cell wall biosynthesis
MPKNILLTSWYSGLGGGETDLLALAAELNPAQWQPHLLLPRDGQLSAKWREMGFMAHIVPYRGASTFFIPAIWTRFPVVLQIARIIREQDIALVHSEYHTLPFAYAAARHANIPIMWTVHGWWFKPKFWQRAFFHRMDAQVARSESIRAGFLGQPPFMPVTNLPVIYSGVDTARFHPTVAGQALRAEIGIAQDVPVVAMVARFQKVKGQHTFQAMARRIAQEMPTVQFIVAGEDTFGVAADADYKRQILESAQHDPLLQSRLHYIGFRDTVEQVYAAADIVVCASDFESYGKANIEAMACGKPVVSTNQGGPTETIVNGETGYLVAAGDAAALAKRVRYLLRHPDERARLGKHGRCRVEQVFSAKSTAEQYTAIFERLITPQSKH